MLHTPGRQAGVAPKPGVLPMPPGVAPPPNPGPGVPVKLQFEKFHIQLTCTEVQILTQKLEFQLQCTNGYVFVCLNACEMFKYMFTYAHVYIKIYLHIHACDSRALMEPETRVPNRVLIEP
jgi:hypothetical protein